MAYTLSTKRPPPPPDPDQSEAEAAFEKAAHKLKTLCDSGDEF